MKFLMYGAGNIGRGFIGSIFTSAGYQVSFIDINRELVDRFNENGQYTVQIAADPPYNFMVHGVDAIDGKDKERVIDAIAHCDIMATSLGAGVLPHVAALIAAGFTRRIKENRGSLDILICENLKDAAHYLRKLIQEHLPVDLHGVMETRLGLVETAIGRMVPVLSAEEAKADPLFVRVEEYDFLPVDRKAFRGTIPSVSQIIPYDPFVYYEDRKLYLHNMSHCICAYLGMITGQKYIWEAMENPEIRLIVQSAMNEAAAMLAVTYNVPFHILQKHAEDLLLRFTNKALGDTCERVARDPARKIAADDRLAAPLRRCLSLNIEAVNIAAGLAAVLYQMDLTDDELKRTLTEVCCLSGHSVTCVETLYPFFKAKAPLSECIRQIDLLKKSLRGRFI